MPDLGAYMEDVHFNWAAARQLSDELRSTARVLEDQIPAREKLAGVARKRWEGAYAHRFDGRVSICTSDAKRFVASMRKAAQDLDELARLAREEQNRREQAREWVDHQNHRSWLEQGWDWVTGGDGPPPPPPVQPPRISIQGRASARN